MQKLIVNIRKTAKNHAKMIIATIEKTNIRELIIISQRIKKERNTIRQRILIKHQNDATILDDFIESTIEEFEEEEECKLEKLNRPINVIFDEKTTVNLTDITIPEDIRLVVGLGPKFCFDTDDNLFSMVSFLADTVLHIEKATPIESHLHVYKQISRELQSYKYDSLSHFWTEFIKYRIKHFRLKYPNILITRSDKGKHGVFIYKDDYILKMTRLISSNNDYDEIPEIDIDVLQNINNDFVDILVQSDALPKTDGNSLKDYVCNPAQMYGLIKIHKTGYPIRPITSACAAPGFKLSKFICKILTEIYNEQGFHILRSSDLIDKLHTIELTDDELMASFDVVSMFTNIQIELMMDIIHKKRNIIEDDYKIRFDIFREILTFLLKTCAVFKFDDKSYKQNDSLAMGSPLSPILARILMTEITDRLIPNMIQPKLLALYVDDSLWILKRNQVDIALNLLNDFHPRIKFTCEREIDNRINFLDITIIRNKDNTISTNWYRKEFASSRLLNFHSTHEKSCIIETAVAFVKTTLKLSSPEFFLSNKFIIEETLRLNSFPETLISSIVYEYYTLLRPPNSKKSRFEGEYVPIKYRKALTGNIKQQVTPLLRCSRIVGVPDRIDTNVFSFIKGRISIENKTNIIISLECNCKRTLVLRHTEYLQRAVNVVRELQSKYNIKKTKCKNNIHIFRMKHVQIKNYSSMKTIFEMLTYANRNRLVDTKVHSPIYYMAKHLNNSFYDIQSKLGLIQTKRTK